MSRPRLHASSLAAIGAALLLLAGCTTPGANPEPAPSAPLGNPVPAQPAPPPKSPPATPVPVIEPKLATITGSEESSTMLDNLTAYVVAIDGQPVAAGRPGWGTPLTLKPGGRRLTVAFNRGKFSAQTVLHLTVRAETSYRLKFETDAQLFGKNSYCEFWIEDVATGEKIGAPIRAPLAKLDPQ